MIGLFGDRGAHVLVDGQYGSTGKGVLAAWLALQAKEQRAGFNAVISNAGPNSGHTFYHGGEKHVLKQLPTFAVASHLLGVQIPVVLSAGAIIDPEILDKEALKYPDIEIYVHPNAAVITPDDKYSEADPAGTISAVAGTRSGTGMALARKVMRDPAAVWQNYPVRWAMPDNVKMFSYMPTPQIYRYFVEVSQGFSLGLNQRFYPKGTSRECTVQQAISDAGIAARRVAKVYMSLRTWPIRVGAVDGFDSGGWYPDQRETDWGSLGVEPELTTVTQRIRRVASFSRLQFEEAVRVNDPDWVFLNFLNYPAQEPDPLGSIRGHRSSALVRDFGIIGSVGATSDDVEILDYGRDTPGS